MQLQILGERLINDELSEKISQFLGKAVVRFINDGCNGDAYLLDSNEVLKITKDGSEAFLAKKLIGKIEPYLPEIYNVYKIPIDGDIRWIIVMEYLDTFNCIKESILIFLRKPMFIEYFVTIIAIH